MVRRGKMGVDVAMLSSDGTHAYLEGTRCFEDWQTQAPRGFVDKVEIKSAKKTRLFEKGRPTRSTTWWPRWTTTSARRC